MNYWNFLKKTGGTSGKILLAAAGLIAGFCIARIFFTSYQISDDSMEPEFKKNRIVIILKTFSPVSGDTVLFKDPADKSRVLFKRIAAAEDDVIEIRSKKIYINGKNIFPDSRVRYSDDRVFPVNFSQRDNMPSLKLKRNEFFLLNDNLDMSFDSRDFGQINKKDIIGKSVHVFSFFN